MTDIEPYLPLTKKQASRAAYRIRYKIPAEDLAQEGVFGLLYAAKHYDPTRGASFETFAARCVHSAIWEKVKAETRVGRRKEWLRPLAVSIDERARAVRAPDFRPGVEARITVDRLLERVNERSRSVLLGMLAGLTPGEIAERERMSGAHYRRLVRGARLAA